MTTWLLVICVTLKETLRRRSTDGTGPGVSRRTITACSSALGPVPQVYAEGLPEKRKTKRIMRSVSCGDWAWGGRSLSVRHITATE